MSGGRVALGSGLLLLALAGCEPPRPAALAPPPVGHYEGSLKREGRPDTRVALDIRHPSPGHYEAELTAPTAPALNFVADTVLYGQQRLLLQRPGGSTETVQLTLEGDFWRGTLALDSLRAEALLVKRGSPTPSTYRVGELPQATGGSAWLFAPADTGTPGPALALLPDAATAPAAALWADALAREGIIVLLLPVADTTATPAEAARLQAAMGLLHNTAGADTTNVGVWAAGNRATAIAAVLAQPGRPRAGFFIAQNGLLTADGKTNFRTLAQQQLPVLGLYGGRAFMAPAADLRRALGSRNTGTVQLLREAGASLTKPTQLGQQLPPELPGAIAKWLHSQ